MLRSGRCEDVEVGENLSAVYADIFKAFPSGGLEILSEVQVNSVSLACRELRYRIRERAIALVLIDR
jgi:hypothetical protein